MDLWFITYNPVHYSCGNYLMALWVSTFHFTFPHNTYTPTKLPETRQVSTVSDHISLYFATPDIRPRFRQF